MADEGEWFQPVERALHAEDIVRVCRVVFAEANEFCKKVTYKSTKDPQDQINRFRNDYLPRVAVTVDMIATGTDVKALEVLIFMRNMRSAGYFEQMKGQGAEYLSGPVQIFTRGALAHNKTTPCFLLRGPLLLALRPTS